MNNHQPKYFEYKLINNVGYHFRTVNQSVTTRGYANKLYVRADYLQSVKPALSVKL